MRGRGGRSAFDPASLHDAALRAVVLLLMNEVERLSAEVADLKEENQRLRDEKSRLKGEQGKRVMRSGRITRVYAFPSLASLVAHQSVRAVQLGAA